MKKLILLSILLIVVLILTGCTRKYECCIGTINADGEFQNQHAEEDCGGYSTTPDWWDFSFDHEEAEEVCEQRANEKYNDSSSFSDGETTDFHCRCERAN